MDIFVQRTYGTYIETKGNALIWQFSEADPEFGYLQSKVPIEFLLCLFIYFCVKVDVVKSCPCSNCISILFNLDMFIDCLVVFKALPDSSPLFLISPSKQELVDHLSVILTPYPVEVIRGGGVSDGYIEVRPAGASKGKCYCYFMVYV